jgi:hypothetical protein
MPRKICCQSSGKNNLGTTIRCILPRGMSMPAGFGQDDQAVYRTRSAALFCSANGELTGHSMPRLRAGRVLEHDPEKWVPVFRKDHAQIKEIERDGDSKKSHHALETELQSPAGGVPWVWNDSIVFSPHAWPFLRSSSVQTIGFQSGARMSRAPALATSTRLPPGS